MQAPQMPIPAIDALDHCVGLGWQLSWAALRVLAQPTGDAATFDEESQDLRRAAP
jgi:hypothetical protein